MKPLLYGLAGAGVLIALIAGPVAGQSRPSGPAGGGGGGGGGGGAAVRAGGGSTGGAPSGGSGGGAIARTGGGSSGGPSSGGSGGGSSSGGGAIARASGGSSGGTSSGSSGGGSSSGYSSGSLRGSGTVQRGGVAWSSNPVNGNSPIVRQRYGAASDNAVPRGARPYGGATSYVGPTIGHAIPRQPSTAPRGGRPPRGGGGGGNINWGYAPWMFAGLGFYDVLYADPYWLAGYWFPYDYGYDYSPNWDPTEEADAGYYGDEQGGVGGLKLKVEPAAAEVLVDGYYMGTVDDFNGAFQKMELTSGPHHVEIRASGFRPITFDVRIEPSGTVTYRGELQPLSKR